MYEPVIRPYAKCSSEFDSGAEQHIETAGQRDLQSILSTQQRLQSATWVYRKFHSAHKYPRHTRCAPTGREEEITGQSERLSPNITTDASAHAIIRQSVHLHVLSFVKHSFIHQSIHSTYRLNTSALTAEAVNTQLLNTQSSLMYPAIKHKI